MNKDECIHCNGKGYNGLYICKGCYELSANEFQKRLEKHEAKASDKEYHIEFVEDVFDIVTDLLITDTKINISDIRASVIHYLDERFGEE